MFRPHGIVRAHVITESGMAIRPSRPCRPSRRSSLLYAAEAFRICQFNLRHWSGRLKHARINGYMPYFLRELETQVGNGLDELWEAQENLKSTERHWS
jgi:hypothetical protein